MRSLPRTLTALSVAFLAAPSSAQNESKEPPEGAPWLRSFVEAHRVASATGRPIFVYSTKTY